MKSFANTANTADKPYPSISAKGTRRKTSTNERDRLRSSHAQTHASQITLIKYGIWVYFFLVIFEGALRKWVLPSLATPLLVVRDPVAIWILFMAIKNKVVKSNLILISVVSIGFVSIFTALAFGHGNLAVALFGARIFVLHFPLIFVIGSVLGFEDVIQFGKVILWMSIPMSMLITVQFYSPQSAWVNRGLGNDIAGAGFSGALGYFRPPGTFSFITGTVGFYSLVACYVFYFLINSKLVSKFLLYSATGALLIAVPLSISRTLFFTVIVTLLFTVIGVSRNSKYFGRILMGFMAMIVVFIFLSNTKVFRTAQKAFTARFQNATQAEGGLQGVIVDRYLGGLVTALQNSSEQPFFGYGSGMGTNAGSMLLNGKVTYLISEGEWGRLIGELGPIMGLALIFFRINLSFIIAKASYKKIAAGNLLPWILSSFVLLNIPQGQLSQPTMLGFSVLGAGLAIASLKNAKVN